MADYLDDLIEKQNEQHYAALQAGEKIEIRDWCLQDLVFYMLDREGDSMFSNYTVKETLESGFRTIEKR